MKGLFAFVTLAALLVLGLYFLGRREKTPEPDTSDVSPATAAQSSTTRAPAPAAAPQAVLRPRTLLEDPRVQAAARGARVEVSRFDRTGREGRVDVRWSSDVMTQGGDFLEALLLEGVIRDIDHESTQLRQLRDPGGRRIWQASFRVYF